MDQDELAAQLVQTARKAKEPAAQEAFVTATKTVTTSAAEVEASTKHGTLLKFSSRARQHSFGAQQQLAPQS